MITFFRYLIKKKYLFLFKYVFLIYFGTNIIACNDNLIDISKPNIIIYLADDLGWKDIGFNNAKVVKTPFLDKF